MPHIHEKIDFTATSYIVCENKVLLHLHKKLKFWLGMGGHIELDEDPIQAVIREAKEEAGVDITLLDPTHSKLLLKDYRGFDSMIAPSYMNKHQINETHQHIDLVYFAVTKNDKLTPEDETMILKWFTEEELSDKKYDLPDGIVFYAKKALELAGQKRG